MELVVIQNRQAVTSSLQVAGVFGKEHKNVIQSIEKLVAQNSATKKFFHEDAYINRGKKYKMYYMDRDGFTLLAMGFTGEKALEFKLKYVQAFNKMESMILQSYLPSYQIDNPISRAEKWIEEQRERERLQKALQLSEPKAEGFDRVINAEGLTSNAKLAKVLSLPFGRNKLIQLLREKGVYQDDNTPYQRFVDLGYFELKISERNGRIYHATHTTGKGIEWLLKKLKEWGIQ